MQRRVYITLLLFLVLPLAARAQEPAAESRWEKAIQAFETQDAQSPPPTGEIVFVGSSSIRMWDTAKSFPELKTINRGFGGSQTADSVEFADRIVIPYKPRIVVFYAGDNDIAAGKSAETVAKDFEAFAAKVHAALPETRIVYIAIKPSIARWNLVETIREANKQTQAYTQKDKRLDFLDIDPLMLGKDGRPRPELFVSDGLHMTPEGYAVWSEALRPLLGKK